MGDLKILGKRYINHHKYKKVKEWKGKIEEWKDNLEKLERALDPNERPVLVLENLDKGLEWAAKLLKVEAKALTKHPYFVFHETHFKVLAQVLAATDDAYKARDAIVEYDKLVKSLDDMGTRADRLHGKYKSLGSFWDSREAARIRRHWIPIVRSRVKRNSYRYEAFEKGIVSFAAQDLLDRTSELLKGYTLLRLEVAGTRVARGTMYVKVMKARSTKGKSTIDQIARQSAEQWWQFLEMDKRDPVGKAEKQLGPLKQLSRRAATNAARVARGEAFWTEPERW